MRSRAFTAGCPAAYAMGAGPARLLGLRLKGHLGVGADADVTVYARDRNVARMFASPRYVIKRGVLVAGTLTSAQTIRIEPPLVITMEQIDAVLDRLADTLSAVHRTL